MSDPEQHIEESTNEESDKISIDEFKKVEMTVGVILSAVRVPDTDKLLQLSVEVGENVPRQIISGIATFFPDPEVLVGKRCPFATNLAPRKLRGLTSNGMIIAASHEDNFSLLEISDAIPAGTKLS